MPETALEESEVGSKKGISFTRNHFYLLFLICFSCPLFSYYFLNSYAFSIVSFLCFIANFLLLRVFEKKMKNSVAKLVRAKVDKLISPSHEKEIEKIKQSHVEEMAQKREEMRQAYLEFEELKQDRKRLNAEIAEIQKTSEEALEKKDGILNEYQQTMQEQRMIIEKNKKYIVKLETKVNDLMYEIRSLLRLEESSEQIALPNIEKEEKMLTHIPKKKGPSVYDLSTILKRYVAMAEQFTGLSHLGLKEGKFPRFLDISFDNFTIDLRHFFESFKDENIGIIYLFSLSENKMVFANNNVKNLLGISTERFVKDFPHLLMGGQSDWKKAISKIAEKEEESFKLLFKCKNKEEYLLQNIFSMVRKGTFAGNVLGILSDAKSL